MKNIINTKQLFYFIIGISFWGCSNMSDGELAPKAKLASDFVEESKAKITEIDAEAFFELYNGGQFYLIDVRTQSEHNSGFIPGSISIPRGVIEFRIDNEAVWESEELYMPLPDELIIVYCKKGSRAALVVDVLQQMGYTNVQSIKGGWNAWHEKYPNQIEIKHSVGGGESHAEEGGC